MRKKERRNKTVLYFILLIILGIATYFGADIAEFGELNNITNTAIIEYKENILKKIINKIKDIFNLNRKRS